MFGRGDGIIYKKGCAEAQPFVWLLVGTAQAAVKPPEGNYCCGLLGVGGVGLLGLFGFGGSLFLGRGGFLLLAEHDDQHDDDSNYRNGRYDDTDDGADRQDVADHIGGVVIGGEGDGAILEHTLHIGLLAVLIDVEDLGNFATGGIVGEGHGDGGGAIGHTAQGDVEHELGALDGIGGIGALFDGVGDLDVLTGQGLDGGGIQHDGGGFVAFAHGEGQTGVVTGFGSGLDNLVDVHALDRGSGGGVNVDLDFATVLDFDSLELAFGDGQGALGEGDGIVVAGETGGHDVIFAGGGLELLVGAGQSQLTTQHSLVLTTREAFVALGVGGFVVAVGDGLVVGLDGQSLLADGHLEATGRLVVVDQVHLVVHGVLASILEGRHVGGEGAVGSLSKGEGSHVGLDFGAGNLGNSSDLLGGIVGKGSGLRHADVGEFGIDDGHLEATGRLVVVGGVHLVVHGVLTYILEGRHACREGTVGSFAVGEGDSLLIHGGGGGAHGGRLLGAVVGQGTALRGADAGKSGVGDGVSTGFANEGDVVVGVDAGTGDVIRTDSGGGHSSTDEAVGSGVLADDSDLIIFGGRDNGGQYGGFCTIDGSLGIHGDGEFSRHDVKVVHFFVEDTHRIGFFLVNHIVIGVEVDDVQIVLVDIPNVAQVGNGCEDHFVTIGQLGGQGHRDNVGEFVAHGQGATGGKLHVTEGLIKTFEVAVHLGEVGIKGAFHGDLTLDDGVIGHVVVGHLVVGIVEFVIGIQLLRGNLEFGAALGIGPLVYGDGDGLTIDTCRFDDEGMLHTVIGQRDSLGNLVAVHIELGRDHFLVDGVSTRHEGDVVVEVDAAAGDAIRAGVALAVHFASESVGQFAVHDNVLAIVEAILEGSHSVERHLSVAVEAILGVDGHGDGTRVDGDVDVRGRGITMVGSLDDVVEAVDRIHGVGIRGGHGGGIGAVFGGRIPELPVLTILRLGADVLERGLLGNAVVGQDAVLRDGDVGDGGGQHRVHAVLEGDSIVVVQRSAADLVLTHVGSLVEVDLHAVLLEVERPDLTLRTVVGNGGIVTIGDSRCRAEHGQGLVVHALFVVDRDESGSRADGERGGLGGVVNHVVGIADLGDGNGVTVARIDFAFAQRDADDVAVLHVFGLGRNGGLLLRAVVDEVACVAPVEAQRARVYNVLRGRAREVVVGVAKRSNADIVGALLRIALEIERISSNISEGVAHTQGGVVEGNEVACHEGAVVVTIGEVTAVTAQTDGDGTRADHDGKLVAVIATESTVVLGRDHVVHGMRTGGGEHGNGSRPFVGLALSVIEHGVFTMLGDRSGVNRSGSGSGAVVDNGAALHDADTRDGGETDSPVDAGRVVAVCEQVVGFGGADQRQSGDVVAFLRLDGITRQFDADVVRAESVGDGGGDGVITAGGFGRGGLFAVDHELVSDGDGIDGDLVVVLHVLVVVGGDFEPNAVRTGIDKGGQTAPSAIDRGLVLLDDAGGIARSHGGNGILECGTTALLGTIVGQGLALTNVTLDGGLGEVEGVTTGIGLVVGARDLEVHGVFTRVGPGGHVGAIAARGLGELVGQERIVLLTQGVGVDVEAGGAKGSLRRAGVDVVRVLVDADGQRLFRNGQRAVLELELIVESPQVAVLAHDAVLAHVGVLRIGGVEIGITGKVARGTQRRLGLLVDQTFDAVGVDGSPTVDLVDVVRNHGSLDLVDEQGGSGVDEVVVVVAQAVGLLERSGKRIAAFLVVGVAILRVGNPLVERFAVSHGGVGVGHVAETVVHIVQTGPLQREVTGIDAEGAFYVVEFVDALVAGLLS